MSRLFEELKGKDIKIKTWEEMSAMENTVIYENEIHTVILFLDDNGNLFNHFSSTMKDLCGKIIKVDENMIPDDLFKENKDLLEEDRDLLYYDRESDNCCYLDKDMFEVLEESKLKDEDEFYVIEETTGKKVFCGTREECFKYYKTHVDIFKNQFKRIAVLRVI